MKKVLIVSGDGNLIEKLRFIFLENYGTPDIVSVSNIDNCLSLACKIIPQIIVVDTQSFTGSMQSFFTAKNSQTVTRKIPVIFFDKGLSPNDVPELNTVIDKSLTELDITNSISFVNILQSSIDNSKIENGYEENNFKSFHDYLNNQGYMLNKVNHVVEQGRYQYNVGKNTYKFDNLQGINLASSQGNSPLEYLYEIQDLQKPFFDNQPSDKEIIRTQQINDPDQRYFDATFMNSGNKKDDIKFFNRIEKQEKENNFEKFKNTFISNISHEVRTPMNVIIGFSRLLESDTIDTAKRKQYVSIIQKSGFQLIETLDKIVELSKIQTNQIVLNKKRIDLNTVFTELDVFSRRKLFENGKEEIISFTIKKGNLQSLLLNSDQSRLIQILKELVDNAVKFTNEGFIELGYKLNNNTIEFYVKDSGVGIDEKSLLDIFKLFKQIDNSQFSRSGLGLGISISQKIVEMMGGKIWAQSQIGIGSIFYLSLPITIL